MPYEIRKRDAGWCVVKQQGGESMGCHDSRAKALDQLRALYAVEPSLASLDWAENRIIASAALRWHNRYQLGGRDIATIHAARRLALNPSPLTAADVVWLDDVARAQPEHRHLSRDLAGRAWPRTAAVSRSRMLRLSKRLAEIDKRLGDRLYAGAVTAMRDALRRAGVKAQVRAKNRGKTAALDKRKLTPAVLLAIRVSPDELLDRAFASYQTDAEQWIRDANMKRARAVADTFDVDPADLEEDPPADHRATAAAAALALGLLARARSALTDSALAPEPLTVPVPFVDIRAAMRLRDGWQQVQTITQGPNRTPGPDAGVTMVPPGSDAIDELLGRVAPTSNFVRGFEWVHGYFGEPKTPFWGHEQVDGEQYTDETRDEVLAADPSEWPYVAVYSVDDHSDCTCYEVITYEPDDGG